MSAQSNAEAMRKGYAAFSRGDMETLRNELFTSDIVWHQGGHNQTSGDYRGPDQVIGLFGKLHQLTDGTFRVQIHDVLASEEHVVVLGHGPQTLSATSVSLVMKQLEQAGYTRERLRREWSGARP